MKDDEIQKKVNAVMDGQIFHRGYAVPVDLNVLEKKSYPDWRDGRVPCLEKVCHMNLSKLSKAMHAIRRYAYEHHLRPSYTVYKKYGKGNQELCFSRNGRADVERNYATHYLKGGEIS